MKKDITATEDLTFLVDTFYNKVIQNEVLKPFFANLDFSVHKPKMVGFWGFILLDQAGYKTDVMHKHHQMKLKPEHFETWIQLFNSTVDEHFEGEKANMAKQRAELMGWTMQSKMD